MHIYQSWNQRLGNFFYHPLLHMQSQIISSCKKKNGNIRTAESKILFVLSYYVFYYVLMGVVSLIVFTVETLGQTVAVNTIQQYFVCEAAGTGSVCDRSSFDKLGTQFLWYLNSIFFGFVPIVNLTFIVNWTAVKKSCHQLQMWWSWQSDDI